MRRFFLIFLIAGIAIACEDAKQNKLPIADTDEVADVDMIVAACGDGAVDENETCEPGDTIACTEVSAGYEGTAICRDDCEGWDLTPCDNIDECAAEPDICGDPAYATCEDTEGSFRCECAAGYVPTSDERLCLPRYDFDGPEYTGDLLLVVNEDVDGNNQAFIGTLPTEMLAAPPVEPTPRDAEFSFPPGRIVPLPAHLTADDLRRHIYRAIEPLPDPEIGDTREFWAYNFNTGQRYLTEAEALYVGDYCILWAEKPVRVNSYSARSIGQEFDETIYPLITENFYEASDVDGNGKITIFFLDAGGQAGGYFSSYELSDFEDSNRTDMIYIEEMTAQWGNYANGIIAHEFTHLVHNNRDEIVEGLPNMNTWVMEGMSTSGEHVYGGFQSDYKSTYNGNDAINRGMSVTYWEYTSQDVIANYALTYLFHQYLRIHSGQGNAFFRELIELPYNDARDHDALIQKYIDPDLDTATMLTNFRIALITNEATGLYGFKKESGFSGFQKRYWPGVDGNDFYLRGGGAIQIKLTKPFKAPKDFDEGIRYIGIFGGAAAPGTREDYLGE